MAMRPLFGIVPVLMDEKVNHPVHAPCPTPLLVLPPWPPLPSPPHRAPTQGLLLEGKAPLGCLSCSALGPAVWRTGDGDSFCLLGVQGNVLEGGDVSGALCLSQAWPGMARTIYGDHQRFLDAYFETYPGEPFPAARQSQNCFRGAGAYVNCPCFPSL